MEEQKRLEKTWKVLQLHGEKALTERYPAGIPIPALERLGSELARLKDSPSLDDYLLFAELSTAARQGGYPLELRGTVSSSFLVWLLGNGLPNPLPAHYYCPECGWFEAPDTALFGLDLPKKACPHCGDAPPLAFEIAEFIRKGKAASENERHRRKLAEYRLAPQLETLAKQHRYLFSRAHAVMSMLTLLRLAHYLLRDPKTYSQIVFLAQQAYRQNESGAAPAAMGHRLCVAVLTITAEIAGGIPRLFLFFTRSGCRQSSVRSGVTGDASARGSCAVCLFGMAAQGNGFWKAGRFVTIHARQQALSVSLRLFKWQSKSGMIFLK